jgi:hypothetical protein
MGGRHEERIAEILTQHGDEVGALMAEKERDGTLPTCCSRQHINTYARHTHTKIDRQRDRQSMTIPLGFEQEKGCALRLSSVAPDQTTT